MNRIVHFEIPADDPEALREFYEHTFGWEFSQWGDSEYWLIKTGDDDKDGIDGGMVKKRYPEHRVINTIKVKNIEAIAVLIKANRGRILIEKMPIPGVGWLLYFADPEGNMYGVMEEDKYAGQVVEPSEELLAIDVEPDDD